LIALVWYFLVCGIDARTNWSISGYPPYVDELEGYNLPWE
jgi:hypothetical protein